MFCLNPYLYSDGDKGSPETLPVKVEELTEMAQYCVDVYENGTTVGDLMYRMYYKEGVTIIAIRGTNSGNVVTDVDVFIMIKVEILFHRGFHDET